MDVDVVAIPSGTPGGSKIPAKQVPPRAITQRLDFSRQRCA